MVLDELPWNTTLKEDVNVSNSSHLRLELDLTEYALQVKFALIFQAALCLISIMINLRVLVTVRWIRRPMSPTLHISLSLAAADALTSTMMGCNLLFSSYLPIFQNIELCHLQTWIEMFRLGGIIITVYHLLALSINHWLGILKPLHYTTFVTSRKVTILTLFLWTMPIVAFMAYFMSEANFWQKCPVEDTSFDTMKFRATFMSFFLVPLGLMIYFYVHILFIVRKQQRKWAKLSRSGSTRNRGMSRATSQQRSTMETNLKAVYTTLLILGSYLVGWLPATMTFVLICHEGCTYNTYEFFELYGIWQFYIGVIVNTLLILKTLVNPIIYSARMIEIKEGRRRMELALSRVFRNSTRSGEYDSSNLQPFQFGANNVGSMNAGVTHLCRFNGSLSIRRSLRSNYPNTLV